MNKITLPGGMGGSGHIIIEEFYHNTKHHGLFLLLKKLGIVKNKGNTFGTYTTPTSALYIKVKMVGGGGGGSSV